MTSHKQTRANRRNAKHSTGPTSERGKNTVRYNSLTHGLRTQTVLLYRDDGPHSSERAPFLVLVLRFGGLVGGGHWRGWIHRYRGRPSSAGPSVQLT